jgi:hypothetical protein
LDSYKYSKDKLKTVKKICQVIMNQFGVLDAAVSRFLPKLSPTLANFDAGSLDSRLL